VEGGGRSPADRLVVPDALTEFATAVLRSVGVPDADAQLVAESLTQADLWGHQSHGMMRLSWYVNRIRADVMKAVTEAETIVDTGPLALLDGHDGVGQVLAAKAAREAIRRAKAHGIGAIGVRNSNHFGTAAFFTTMAASDNCVGLLTTNTSPAMAPWGGRERKLGNNPWSVAAPAGRHGVAVMDAANTAVARGKVYLARQQGLPIPLGWAANAQGEPTTDPVEAIEGLILPMAEHKGYAIAFMIDVLSGVLTGSSFGTGVSGPYQAERRSGCGHLYVALDIPAFQPIEKFNQRLEELIAEMKSAAPAKDSHGVYFPGEIEALYAARAHREGLRLPIRTVDDLELLGRETGVDLAPALYDA
jgi:LDH2 family malate/lactate/ureidoglycolate dehydrogenase